jgi:hypothetical protein
MGSIQHGPSLSFFGSRRRRRDNINAICGGCLRQRRLWLWWFLSILHVVYKGLFKPAAGDLALKVIELGRREKVVNDVDGRRGMQFFEWQFAAKLERRRRRRPPLLFFFGEKESAKSTVKGRRRPSQTNALKVE